MPQLKETLPKRWALLRNLEGRYLFNTEEGTMTWEHPDPGIDKAAYEFPTHHNKLDPDYEALSYVWGSDQKPHHLLVEGGQVCTRLPVTHSLMTALRHL